MEPLLIELGTEELPVKALPGLAQALFDNLIDGLAPNVQGAYENSWPLSSYDFKSYSLA